MSNNSNFRLNVPTAIRDAIVASHGAFCERLSGTDRYKIVDDVLDQTKAEQQAAILERHVNLDGSRVLEVGTGLGMNLITWMRTREIDMVGIEPDAEGFEASFKLARELARANHVDPERIVSAVGEALPFEDDSFDVVYSSNVLEHTNQPARVLAEALRVLRPGGVLQFVYPNYASYFDGHYGVFHPPILWRGFFPWYVKWIWRRDPAFARTIRTELNPRWTRRQLRALQGNFNIELLGLGEDLFLERMTSLDFAAWASLGRVKRLLQLIGNPTMRRMLGQFIIGIHGWTPIVLTLRKRP